jgi:archaellum component FlaF (FlaF/FlaG flagellin family)
MLYNPCNQLSYTLHDSSDIAIVTPNDSMQVSGISALEKRSITIINELEVKSKTVELRFYDNGSIDGDIISIYFNGTLIQERQTLGASPIRLTLQLREGSDNVIAMYAENLGAIPPNTALMLVDDGTNTTEVLLSSDLNASGAVRIRVARP